MTTKVKFSKFKLQQKIGNKFREYVQKLAHNNLLCISYQNDIKLI